MLGKFVINFLAYAFVFIFIVALVLVACFIGIKWRKSKNEKADMESSVEAENANAPI